MTDFNLPLLMDFSRIARLFRQPGLVVGAASWVVHGLDMPLKESAKIFWRDYRSQPGGLAEFELPQETIDKFVERLTDSGHLPASVVNQLVQNACNHTASELQSLTPCGIENHFECELGRKVWLHKFLSEVEDHALATRAFSLRVDRLTPFIELRDEIEHRADDEIRPSLNRFLTEIRAGLEESSECRCAAELSKYIAGLKLRMGERRAQQIASQAARKGRRELRRLAAARIEKNGSIAGLPDQIIVESGFFEFRYWILHVLTDQLFPIRHKFVTAVI